MRNGAFDYLIKPFSSEQIEVTLKKAEEFTQLVRVNRYLSHEESDDTGYELLGHSPAMETLRQLVRKVARTQATVLIQGESGTGKELVARALYRESPRANAAFIRVNCAAVPENLIESEFFGHEKGAFTGAIAKSARGASNSPTAVRSCWTKSARSPRRFRPSSSASSRSANWNASAATAPSRVDVRVIATTNRNLEQSVQRKEFRQDLFFRLNVVPICVPPLRDRRSDIPLLAEQFMLRFARKHGVRVNGVSDPSMAALMDHDWPGNVRELQNVIERAVILCGDGGLLETDHLGFAPVVSHSSAAPGGQPGDGSVAAAGGLPSGNGIVSLAELERIQIFRALEHTGGNRTHAARLLGISIRTLRNKLHEYGRDVKEGDTDDPPETAPS